MPPSRERPGYEYRTCIWCHRRWNVSRLVPPKGDYICPACRGKRKETKEK